MLQGRMMNYYKVKREHVCVYVYQENGHLVVALERHRASHQRQRSLYTFALFTERVVLEQNTTLRTRFGCRESNLLWQGVWDPGSLTIGLTAPSLLLYFLACSFPPACKVNIQSASVTLSSMRATGQNLPRTHRLQLWQQEYSVIHQRYRIGARLAQSMEYTHTCQSKKNTRRSTFCFPRLALVAGEKSITISELILWLFSRLCCSSCTARITASKMWNVSITCYYPGCEQQT